MVFPLDSIQDFSVVLTPEHEMFRKAVREFVEREVAPRAMEIEEKDEVPRDLLKKIAEQGFFGIGIPEKYGGQGGDHRMAAIMSEEFCRVLPGLSVYFGTNELFITPIMLFGSEEQRQKYIPPIAKGEKFGAFAVTEPCCGSDVAGIQTRAEKVGNKWVINGRKAFISSSDIADYFIVLARTYPPPDKKLRYLGLTFFIVERDTPGFKVEQCYHKMGLHGDHACELVFENVEVPDENRVGEEGMGFLYAMETFDRTRIGVAAQAVGMAQGAFEKAFQYVHQRQAFGVPIAYFQAIQFSLVEMMAKIFTARLLTYLAAKLADENRKEFTFVASLAKFYATEVAEEVISEAINLHGGVGVIRETGVERFLRDVKITQIYEGANNIQKLVAYRQLIRILREKGQIPEEVAKLVT
ncbi:Butyryl-CoA dehydrogenase [Pyrobaculum islandicum DSM 4184]|uniref:Butyryl-CoA dehydrogenase n=1 Tax=Pyrobaculum islandicum (strain DSM 4184 / JCM 9189 / GEO3) TaxID=384616 RepID=A1RUG1_PYRIL|nr:acyl-CoA dehydrogenase family protein [Pyrobaculum islandicum]ABL88593.1 Butyryl-CoA dehydrogenase [Pyrobaculum islandicum DSM 4184]